MKKIAVITMARNDTFFLGRWIKYYGANFGAKNLYIYLDGLDQEIPKFSDGANITKLPHLDMTRAAGDKYRIGKMSDLAADLFGRGYDIVIGTDADEFLIADPATGKNLPEYLSELNINTSVSPLGLDVGMDLSMEFELDIKLPFLAQRDFALLSTRYTKPVVINKPVRWGSGFHRVKNHNFHMDKNLYLLHFGSVDYEMIRSKIGDRNPDWKKHLARRADTIFTITNSKKHDEKYINIMRRIQTFMRPIYAPTKPAQFGLKPVVKIPARFKEMGI